MLLGLLIYCLFNDIQQYVTQLQVRINDWCRSENGGHLVALYCTACYAFDSISRQFFTILELRSVWVFIRSINCMFKSVAIQGMIYLEEDFVGKILAATCSWVIK